MDESLSETKSHNFPHGAEGDRIRGTRMTPILSPGSPVPKFPVLAYHEIKLRPASHDGAHVREKSLHDTWNRVRPRIVRI